MAPKSRELMKHRSNRQQTFVETVKVTGGGESLWSDLIGESSIQSLVDLGFYYAPTKVNKNRVICFLCNKSESIFDEFEIDSIALQHYKKSKTCVRALIALSNQMRSQFGSRKAIYGYWQNHEQKVLSSPSGRPAQRFRERTYGDKFVLDLKEGYKPNTRTLAAAGFLYAPLDFQDDKVSCVYCGCSLDHWEQNDDPVEEHKHNSRGYCYFLDKLGFEHSEENEPEVNGVDNPKIDNFLGLFSDTNESDNEDAQDSKQNKNELANTIEPQDEGSIQKVPGQKIRVNLLKAPKSAKKAEEKEASKIIFIDDKAIDDEVEEVSDFDDSDYGNKAEETESSRDNEIAKPVDEKDVKDNTISEVDVSTIRRSTRISKLRAEKDPNIDYWDKVPDDDLYDEFMGAARRTTKSNRPIVKDRGEEPLKREKSNDSNDNINESDINSNSDIDSDTEEVAEDSLKDFYDDESSSEILDESNYIPEGSDIDNVDQVEISSNSLSEVDDSLVAKRNMRKRKTPAAKQVESNEGQGNKSKRRKTQDPAEEVISSVKPKKLKFTKKSASATPPRFDETNEDMDIYQDANVENLEMNVKVFSAEKLSPVKDSKPDSHILPPPPTIHSLEFVVDSENSHKIAKNRITNTKSFKSNKSQRRNIFDMSFDNEFPGLRHSLSPVRIPVDFGKRLPITSLPTLNKEDLEVQKNSSIEDLKPQVSPSLSEQVKVDIGVAEPETQSEENESKQPNNSIENIEFGEINKGLVSEIDEGKQVVDEADAVAKEKIDEGYKQIDQLPLENNEDKDEVIYSSGESDVDYANYIEDIRGINAEISKSMEVIEQELEQGEAPGESEVDSMRKSSTENEPVTTETNESETSLEIGYQIDAESTKLDNAGLEKEPTVHGEMAVGEVSKEIVDSVSEGSEEFVAAIDYHDDQQMEEDLPEDTPAKHSKHSSVIAEHENADEIEVEVDEVTEISFGNAEVEPQKQHNEPHKRYAVPESSLMEEIRDSVRSYDDSTNRLTISKIRYSLPIHESSIATVSKEESVSETKQSVVEDDGTEGIDIGLSSQQVSPIAHNTSSHRASSPSEAAPELPSGNTPASNSSYERFDAMIESSTPQKSNSIRSLTVKQKISEALNLPKKWVQKPLVQFSDELANLEETAVHLRNLAALGYDLRDDPGDLTSLLADMPEEEENMTIKEWVENCAANCRNLIEDQCAEMTAFVVNEYKRAISVIEALPTVD